MHTTVEQVMSRQVIAVTEDTCFKDIAATLITHGVSAVPVLAKDGRVVGIVSEADLTRAEECRELFRGEGYQAPVHGDGRDRAGSTVAGELMTTPAVTVTPETPVTVASRMMDEHGVKRLPVVTGDGRLAGIVSRRDVLKVFVRSDQDLEHEIKVDILSRSLWMDTARVHVAVADGVVTITGRMGLRRDTEVTVWMVRQVDGVVEVRDQLGWDRDDTPVGG
ncbi:CBS domain-containing protein [Acrocarpospora catenulata]|uniref:CBS domain-containing protein n=1 Tax=Acrocarpospora catenulata TaxID=2836182 RepID=UPI001BDA3D6E|nr:CBS domain-containing protein [Acrocarpospora catenulata]